MEVRTGACAKCNMDHNRRKTIHRLTLCGAIAAVYAVVTISTASFSYGAVQFRIAEALCVLPAINPCCVWGLFVGCVLANLLSTVSAFDILIGSAATLLAALLTARIRKPYLVPLPTILLNGLMVGAMLAVVYPLRSFFEGFALYFGQVALGETVVLYALGVPLLLYLRRSEAGTRLKQM